MGDILLLVGVVKKRHALLLPWLAVSALLVSVIGLTTVGLPIFYFVMEAVIPGVIILVVGAAVTSLYAYIWAVVCSQHANLRERARETAATDTKSEPSNPNDPYASV